MFHQTNLVTGDIAAELLRLLGTVASTVYSCKGTAERLITLINDVQPTIREIQYSGVELSQHRQTQIRIFIEILEKARRLSEKVLRCRRFNPKHLYHANKMKDLEKKIRRFTNASVPCYILADVNHHRFSCEASHERIETKCDRLNERMEYLSLAEARKRAEATVEIETEVDPAIQREGLDLGKRKMKEMMSKFTDAHLFGISGMSGSGKTTLAQELFRDEDVRERFKVLFLTVSRSPKLENLRSHIEEFIDDGNQKRKLVILDDVWTVESLDRLLFKVPGITTLVVSRSKLADPRTTYNVELLKENEAVSLFCICAFGDKSMPSRFSRVFAHIEKSLDDLDSRTRKCFLDLGAFPEDKKIPLDVVINMWVEMQILTRKLLFPFLFVYQTRISLL